MSLQENGHPDGANLGAALDISSILLNKNGDCGSANQAPQGRKHQTPKSEGAKSEQGQPFVIKEPEPWHDSVDGALLLDDISRVIQQFVVLSSAEADAIALWVLHTYSFDIFPITPRLAITSPEKRCGKTTLVDVLSVLVQRPVKTENITAPALFRLIGSAKPTVLMDEADTFLSGKDELRGVLNSGHRKGGQIIRTVGQDFEPRQFATFCPVAIAKIGKMAPTLEDRSIIISLKRKTREQPVSRFRLERVEAAFTAVRARAIRWTNDNREKLDSAEPEVPDALHDRAADNWAPLFAIADAANETWKARARNAALKLSVDLENGASIGELLLMDIRTIFAAANIDRMFTHDLVRQLSELSGRPWGDWNNGLPMSDQSLARHLNRYAVEPGTIRVGAKTAKGYYQAAFADAWARYVPDASIRNRA